MASKEKKHRISLTVQEKIHILDELKKPGLHQKDAVKKFEISASTVVTLQNNEDKLRCRYAASHLAPAAI